MNTSVSVGFSMYRACQSKIIFLVLYTFGPRYIYITNVCSLYGIEIPVFQKKNYSCLLTLMHFDYTFCKLWGTRLHSRITSLDTFPSSYEAHLEKKRVYLIYAKKLRNPFEEQTDEIFELMVRNSKVIKELNIMKRSHCFRNFNIHWHYGFELK